MEPLVYGQIKNWEELTLQAIAILFLHLLELETGRLKVVAKSELCFSIFLLYLCITFNDKPFPDSYLQSRDGILQFFQVQAYIMRSELPCLLISKLFMIPHYISA